VGELLCWIGSSKDKLKNAESLQGMRSMRKTKPFGSKPPRVGKSSFERSNKFIRSARAAKARSQHRLGPLLGIVDDTATTIVKSEIGRRNAKDTKFIVPPELT
jgi:hypothetical protein